LKHDPPLAGVRVLDLARGALGAIGRTLAELGCEVVRVEPRGGGSDRDRGPTVAGVGLEFAAANLGKLAVGLDLSDVVDRARFDQLAARADVIIESAAPNSNDGRLLDAAGLRRRHSQLIILSLPDFGAGAHADWVATDAVLHALSGQLSRSGVPGREPLLPPGEIAVQCAAAQGVYAILIAYLHRLQTGEGDHLELSLLEAVTQSLDPGFGITGSAAGGVPPSALSRRRPDARHQYPIISCRDGFVRLCILASRQWQGLFDYMGQPAEFADPAFSAMRHRFASTTLLPAIAAFLADKTRAEVEAGGERLRFPAASLLTLSEALDSEQIRAREAFAEVEIAPGFTAPFPDGVMEIDGARAGLRGPPPSAAQDPDVVLQAWSLPRPGVTERAPGEPGRPLAGLRVLDLGIIVVGSEHGRLLADYGAEVIKIENAAFPDGSRVSAPGPLPATFAAGHRNKLGFGLNLRDPAGRELFLELADKSDVILSNFKPGTLEALGLGPDVLLKRNPHLILADSSAFGTTGPWRGRMGYGPLVRASAGLTERWRYPDEPDNFCDAMTIYPDHVAARIGAVGVLALLVRRLRTGRGGQVSVSQTEVMLGQMAAEIAAQALAARGVAVGGEPTHDAPYGVFSCAGDDEWCVVTVRSDAAWRSLCRVMMRPDLAADAALATAAGRNGARRQIDEAVGAWTATLAPNEVAEQLQAAGVPAAAMLRVSELPDFSYFRERGLFQELHHPLLDQPILVDNAPVRSQRLSPPPLGPAPLMGEHTRVLARRLLGLGDRDIDRLLEAGVLEATAAG
jgi:crotonobetainyl-CoA:carnitine CoA-transferase CaiB-like acyl-CoA transferase